MLNSSNKYTTDFMPVIEEALAHAKSKGKTQESVLSEAGVFKSSLSQWRSGEHTPSSGRVILIVNACGLHLKTTLIPNN